MPGDRIQNSTFTFYVTFLWPVRQRGSPIYKVKTFLWVNYYPIVRPKPLILYRHQSIIFADTFFDTPVQIKSLKDFIFPRNKGSRTNFMFGSIDFYLVLILLFIDR